MPHQASDGRQPAPGIADAYLATPADLQTHADAHQTIAAMNQLSEKISYANTSYLDQGTAVGLVPEAVILGSKQNLVARPKDHW